MSDTFLALLLCAATIVDSAPLSDSGRVVAFYDEPTGRGGLQILDPDSTIVSSFGRPGYHPFLIRLGDIDGDGTAEIAVGLTDSAQFRPDRRAVKLHLFRIESDRLVPFWFTERTYADLAFIRSGGRDLLATIEETRRESRLRIYSWHGFGFWLEDEIRLGRPPCRIVAWGESLRVENATGKSVEFIFDGDKIRKRTSN